MVFEGLAPALGSCTFFGFVTLVGSFFVEGWVAAVARCLEALTAAVLGFGIVAEGRVAGSVDAPGEMDCRVSSF